MSVNRVIVYTISRLLTTYVSGGDVCCTRKGGEKTVHYRPRVCVCLERSCHPLARCALIYSTYFSLFPSAISAPVPCPFQLLLSTMAFQLLSTTAITKGNILTCLLSLCHFSSCLLSLAHSAVYRCIPSQPMETLPSKGEMTVRVHHVAGWPQVHTYGDIKVKILETRKGADRLIAVTKTASPYNEEFTFEWDVSSQLTFEVFSEGRLAKDARTLWRVTPGKITPIRVPYLGSA